MANVMSLDYTSKSLNDYLSPMFLFVTSRPPMASWLRYLRPNGRANENTRFSEAIFQDNSLYPTLLTPFFLVKIFLRLKIGYIRFEKYTMEFREMY